MDDAGEGPNETAFEVGIDAASLDGYENGHDRADHFALDRATRYPVGNSTAAGAVANFVNTIVGAGIIGLPFALAQASRTLSTAVLKMEHSFPVLYILVDIHDERSGIFDGLRSTKSQTAAATYLFHWKCKGRRVRRNMQHVSVQAILCDERLPYVCVQYCETYNAALTARQSSSSGRTSHSVDVTEQRNVPFVRFTYSFMIY